MGKPQPTAIDDGEFRWTIEFCDEIKHNGIAVDGLCIPPRDDLPGRLMVRVKDCCYQDIIATLLGEICHAGEFAQDTRLPEATLHGMARYLTRVFRLNPHLLGMIAAATRRDK